MDLINSEKIVDEIVNEDLSYKQIFIVIIVLVGVYLLIKKLTKSTKEIIYENFEKNGFCKISNFLTNEINDLNEYIDFIENNFPVLIAPIMNNGTVTNFNRSSIEFVTKIKYNNLGTHFTKTAFPFNKYKQIKYDDKLAPFQFEIPNYIKKNIYSDDILKKKVFFNNNKTYFDSTVKFEKSNVKKKISILINRLVNKLKNQYPKIVKKNYDIYHAICFYVYPNALEQEIHYDPFYFESKQLDSCQIFIPLHNSTIENGPTIFYKKSKINNNVYKIYPQNRLGFINEIKNNKIKKMFSEAKFQEPFKKNDIYLVDKDTYHSGGENKTNITRKTLLIQLIE